MSLRRLNIRRLSPLVGKYGGGPAYDPDVALFSPTNRGLVYHYFDKSKLSQDTAGATPVTATAQPVGRVLDLTHNGNHATQATALSKPTYTEAGGLTYVSSDGGDVLLSPVLDMSHTNKMTYWCRLRAAGGGSVIAELGTSFTTDGSFYFSTEGGYTANMGGPLAQGFNRSRAGGSWGAVADTVIIELDRANVGSPVIYLNGVSVGTIAGGGTISGNFSNTLPLATFARWTGSAISVGSTAQKRAEGLIDRIITPDERAALQTYLDTLP